MASRKGCLSINEVIAALGEENDSEIDSDSSSELDESTDDSADEVQVSSMANADPFFQVSLFYSDDNLQQVNNNILKKLKIRILYIVKTSLFI